MSVVAGEASESDEEIENTSSSLPDLQVDQEKLGDGETLLVEKNVDQDHFSADDKQKKSKYNSILHKKLRDKNAAFYRNLTESVGQIYTISAKDISNNTQAMIKSKAMIEEVCQNMKKASEDLDTIQKQVDIIASCTILPEFKRPAKLAEGAVGGAPT